MHTLLNLHQKITNPERREVKYKRKRSRENKIIPYLQGKHLFAVTSERLDYFFPPF